MSDTISAHSDRCTGCMSCQLACSFTRYGEFRPSKARIRLSRLGGQERYTISFSADCRACGVCARYCPYGALEVTRGGRKD
jgi:carbon-monoxide dehydrogenase iron sulfur subunit